ncbi:hypothetical protein [Rhodococcus erythropolis]|uniref:hypothetical protein n=1 Tax=Rhodococcus erythropolis TaxID=1833 RepID=UPI0018A2DB67|nr:hypothetical protein [Rhodococcus erythropolis]MBF7736698.1 hypothetical protein [Rhodococcus erythropolis]MCZ4644051.1 hypothetical protein [Rhodococcus erythropolis]
MQSARSNRTKAVAANLQARIEAEHPEVLWHNSAAVRLELEPTSGLEDPDLFHNALKYLRSLGQLKTKFLHVPRIDTQWDRLVEAASPFLLGGESDDFDKAAQAMESVLKRGLNLDPRGTKVLDNKIEMAELETNAWKQREAERTQWLSDLRHSRRTHYEIETARAEAIQIWGRSHRLIEVLDYAERKLNTPPAGPQFPLSSVALAKHFSSSRKKPYTRNAANGWIKDLVAYGILVKTIEHVPSGEQANRRPVCYAIKGTVIVDKNGRRTPYRIPPTPRSPRRKRLESARTGG